MFTLFITTELKQGPGFTVFWSPSYFFNLQVRRDQDTVTEHIKISPSDFLADFGYNTWHHYVVTYKYDGINNGTNMDAFINGIRRPDTEKSAEAGFYGGDNTEDYDGRLQLGVYWIGHDTARGNMKMDEILIWERKISAEDVMRLYEAYPCV